MSVTRSHKASLDADFKNDISTLIKDEIIKAMNSEEMKSAISSQVKQLIKSELNSIVKPLEDDLASIKAENSRLRVELLNIKKQNTTLSLHANANEQYSRKYNVRISGIEEVHAEDCFAAVSIFFETELGVTVNESDIDRVHRVGRRGLSPRQMIVKFESYRAKERVVKNRSKLKGKKGFYVNEDLTSFNLVHLRKARMAGHVQHTWASDGKIFVKLEDESIHVVRCPDDILALQQEK